MDGTSDALHFILRGVGDGGRETDERMNQREEK